MHFTCPAPGWLTPRLAPTSLATLLIGFFVAGCHDGDVPSEPGAIIQPLSARGGVPGKPGGGGGGGDDAETFLVSIRTCDELDEAVPGGPCAVPGNHWTDAPRVMQGSGKLDWLHVFDSGGNGTRGKPKYPGAFDTKIFLQPADAAGCVGDMQMNLPNLFGKLDQSSSDLRVFDFQVGYGIADNPTGFSFFLFRWQDADGTFAASTGFGFDGSQPAPSIDFLGDNPPLANDITDGTIPRVFRITGAKVIAQELNKNKVIRMLECPNPHIIEVTVAPNP